MKNGYTIPELMILIIVLGFISILTISRVSYAFAYEDNNQTTNLLLVKTASIYGERTIKEELKNNGSKFISSNDVIEAGYLVDDDNLYKNYKIKLSYDSESDSVVAEVVE